VKCKNDPDNTKPEPALAKTAELSQMDR